MKIVFIFFLLPTCLLAQAPATGPGTSQASAGNCSPNIVNNGSGTITVELPGSCGSVDPQVLAKLTESLQKFVGQFPKTISRLNELLDKKDVEIAQKTKEVQDWIDRFNELSNRLEQKSGDDELSRQAADALHSGDLLRAENLLKDLLAKEEKQVDLTAQNQFNLAQLLELRFEPLQALDHYRKAYNYRPDNPAIGEAYAILLHKEKKFGEAETILLHILATRRELAKASFQAYSGGVASTLSNLGALYIETDRLREASDVLTESLEIDRALAKTNPEIYLPEVAKTLNNLGVLYNKTLRLKEAVDAFAEALQIFRELPEANPQAKLAAIARMQINLGTLYRQTRQL